MMVRNRQAIFWALFFPLLLVVAFGMFDFNNVGTGRMLIVDRAGTPLSQQIVTEVAAVDLLEIVTLDGETAESQARQRLAQGDVDYLLIIPSPESAPDSVPEPVNLIYGSGDAGRNQLVDGTVRYIVRQAASGAGGLVKSQEIAVDQVSYFEVVLMGLVGLGIMTNSIISIAVRISTYRNMSILKRLLVTPLPIWKYFVGEVGAHLVVALVQAAIIIGVGVLVFGARLHGNLAWIFVIVALGSLVFLNIGFIVSAWSRTPAAASGMGNAIALPMMFFAGTFFSTAALPWILPYVAEALPLTPMLVALRDVANGGEPLWNTWPQLTILGGWVIGTGAVATKVFKFN
jgi:ABC-2 type transport system permease protein